MKWTETMFSVLLLLGIHCLPLYPPSALACPPSPVPLLPLPPPLSPPDLHYQSREGCDRGPEHAQMYPFAVFSLSYHTVHN